MDVNGHLGGPIIKDKLWFYVGGQYYRTKNRSDRFPRRTSTTSSRGSSSS